jgi:hypothetical protein
MSIGLQLRGHQDEHRPGDQRWEGLKGVHGQHEGAAVMR